jgi:hypothetical protein
MLEIVFIRFNARKTRPLTVANVRAASDLVGLRLVLPTAGKAGGGDGAGGLPSRATGAL